MQVNYRKFTETEYEIVGKFVEQTGKTKRKLYTLVAATLAVIVLFPSSMLSITFWINVDGQNYSMAIIYEVCSIVLGIGIFSGWFLCMRKISMIKKTYTEGKFMVCPVTVTSSERISKKRGIIADFDEDYSEGRNQFYLVGKMSDGTEYKYRVSGEEYKKSKTHKQALAILWEIEGFYGNCDLLIK